MLRSKVYTISIFFCSAALAAGQNRTVSVPSLTATVGDTFVRPLAGGNSITKTITGQFYRDAQGRTRTERGQLVTIQDPTTRTTVVVDMTSKTARRFTAAQPIPIGTSMSAVIRTSGIKSYLVSR